MHLKVLKKNTLFITTYHDQGLIPFKSLNKSGINLTLGLKYRRLSPIHGTASDKKFNNEQPNMIELKEILKPEGFFWID